MRILAIALALHVVTASAEAQPTLRIKGTGAAYVAPLLQEWIAEYRKVRPEASVSFDSATLQAAEDALSRGEVDFIISPSGLESAVAEKAGIVQFPIVADATVLVHNADVHDLRLDADVLAAVYLGHVSKWNDPALVAINPEAKLADRKLTPIHDTAGSTVTLAITRFLALRVPEFERTVGTGRQVEWPCGIGIYPDVKTTFAKRPDSLAYVPFAVAQEKKLPTARIRNRSGAFVAPSASSIAAAQDAALSKQPNGMIVSLLDQEGDAVYPMASLYYVRVTRQPPSGARAVADFLSWSALSGQKRAAELNYAPLSDKVQTAVLARINDFAK